MLIGSTSGAYAAGTPSPSSPWNENPPLPATVEMIQAGSILRTGLFWVSAMYTLLRE